MNELMKQNDQYLARYEGSDPYAQFASEGGPGIQGKLLQCKKGDWSIGADGAAVPAGAKYLLLVDTKMRGWLRWQGGVVTSAEMGLVRDNYLVKHRYALGDIDETAWETMDGKPRDPWAQSYRVLLIEVSAPHGDVTFAGSSYGTALALKEVCRVYSAEAAQHPDAYPVVSLATKTRPNKQWGPIKGPWFDLHGWATIADIKAGRKAQAALAKPKKKVKAAPATGELLNDEIPDWS